MNAAHERLILRALALGGDSLQRAVFMRSGHDRGGPE
jgi:hypothetical protein